MINLGEYLLVGWRSTRKRLSFQCNCIGSTRFILALFCGPSELSWTDTSPQLDDILPNHTRCMSQLGRPPKVFYPGDSCSRHDSLTYNHVLEENRNFCRWSVSRSERHGSEMGKVGDDLALRLRRLKASPSPLAEFGHGFGLSGLSSLQFRY